MALTVGLAIGIGVIVGVVMFLIIKRLRDRKKEEVTKFLDVHPTSGVNEDMLKKMQNELPDDLALLWKTLCVTLKMIRYSAWSKLRIKAL